jgi:hypothetical protein
MSSYSTEYGQQIGEKCDGGDIIDLSRSLDNHFPLCDDLYPEREGEHNGNEDIYNSRIDNIRNRDKVMKQMNEKKDKNVLLTNATSLKQKSVQNVSNHKSHNIKMTSKGGDLSIALNKSKEGKEEFSASRIASAIIEEFIAKTK